MAISNPIIDAGPTKARIDIDTIRVNTIPVDPTENEEYVTVVDGKPKMITILPTNHGRVCFYRNQDLDSSAEMYVAIDLEDGNGPQWKRVLTSVTVIDDTTGLPWDSDYYG